MLSRPGEPLSRPGEPLSSWTTLRLGGPARDFVTVGDRRSLYDVVADLDARGERVLVLGGGSNLVVPDAGFDGTVVKVATAGVNVGGDACGGVEVVTEAGEDWDALVARAVASEWIGVEALAGIPGTVGATPIQNVGAYGQDVADTVAAVETFDRHERRTRTFFNADCKFGYRTSVFKQHPGRYIVGSVTFQFKPGSIGASVRYAGLARTLGVEMGERATTRAIREAVLALRRGKGMVLDPDDHDTWSAGSFFTNPFVDADRLPEGAPGYPQPDGSIKTSAAWLIEQAGFAKGYGKGEVRVSSKHTLALTNRGRGTTEELLALAREIRAGVRDRFGIDLDAEPTLIYASL